MTLLDAHALVSFLTRGPGTAYVRSIPLDVALARHSAEVRAAHYHRTSRPISLADAILVA